MIAVPGVYVSRFNVVLIICTTRIIGLYGPSTSIFLVIYCPGSVPITSAFFDDLSRTIEQVVGYNEHIYIVGDINVLLDRSNDSNARQPTDLFDAFRFVVRNAQPTHVLGGLWMLSLLVGIYRHCASLRTKAELSDHQLLQ